ncbi:FIMAH domain-containing protein [Paenibacillus lautus]|uniref:FIMAH domain-containing protein n=1 Tax=Paenibacillus lautus TaxID=1401 RepID=UPI003D2AF52F
MISSTGRRLPDKIQRICSPFTSAFISHPTRTSQRFSSPSTNRPECCSREQALKFLYQFVSQLGENKKPEAISDRARMNLSYYAEMLINMWK